MVIAVNLYSIQKYYHYNSDYIADIQRKLMCATGLVTDQLENVLKCKEVSCSNIISWC